MSQYQPKFKHEAVIRGNIPPKPKRPLTVFNLFSILERNFIVQQNQKRASTPSASTDINTDPYLATRPERYRDVVLPFNWFVVGMNRVKRSKHKVHGVISFNELTKEISNRWKSVDAETRKYCETIAADELQRYRRNMAAYESTYGQDAVKAQKRTRAKHFSNNCIAKNNQCLRNDDIPECRHARGSQLREMENGLASVVDMGLKVRGIYNIRHKLLVFVIQRQCEYLSHIKPFSCPLSTHRLCQAKRPLRITGPCGTLFRLKSNKAIVGNTIIHQTPSRVADAVVPCRNICPMIRKRHWP
ncbi:hypothetical protein ACHAW6_005590 [Cyclotella cf. meneghiniana]